MLLCNRFFKKIALLMVFSGLLLLIYAQWIQPRNAYMHMRTVEITLPMIALWIIWVFLAAVLLPYRIDKSSDCFLFFYVLFVVVGGATLWGSSGILDIFGRLALLGLLVFPAIAFLVVVALTAVGLNRYVRLINVAKLKSYRIPIPLLIVEDSTDKNARLNLSSVLI